MAEIEIKPPVLVFFVRCCLVRTPLCRAALRDPDFSKIFIFIAAAPCKSTIFRVHDAKKINLALTWERFFFILFCFGFVKES